MNFGRGSTNRERPKKAFEAYKEKYPKRIDFGESVVAKESVYRRRWAPAKSWFWTIVKLIILIAILLVILSEIIRAWT